MRYIVAVSGGVDSVVLLDMLARTGEHELIVAHFDHGIRPESADDAAFVRALAGKYGLRFEMKREELGPKASEELARTRRYAFLRGLAQIEQATIATAHHSDDIIETIAINLSRGTGWRGLAVLNDPTIERPLGERCKQEVYAYAVSERLEWVEDATNHGDAYLRNRLRRRLAGMSPEAKQELLRLQRAQRQLAGHIDREAASVVSDSRYFLTMIDEPSAQELLRSLLATRSLALTRPQRSRLLHAIKTIRPGSTFEAGPGVRIGFTKRHFIVKHPL